MAGIGQGRQINTGHIAHHTQHEAGQALVKHTLGDTRNTPRSNLSAPGCRTYHTDRPHTIAGPFAALGLRFLHQCPQSLAAWLARKLDRSDRNLAKLLRGNHFLDAVTSVRVQSGLLGCALPVQVGQVTVNATCLPLLSPPERSPHLHTHTHTQR